MSILRPISTYFDATEDQIKKCLRHTSLSTGLSEEEIGSRIESIVKEARGKAEIYSTKAIVVRREGLDDNVIKGLIELGKKYRMDIRVNENLKGGPGYIFPRYLRPTVQRYLLFGNEGGGVVRDYVRKEKMYARLLKVFSLSGKPILGAEAIAEIRREVLPHPEDSDIYSIIISSIDPKKEYKHIELISMFYDIFYPRERVVGELNVHTFRPERSNKRVYWIVGTEEQVRSFVDKTESENPQSFFQAKVFRLDNGRFAAWLDHLTGD